MGFIEKRNGKHRARYRDPSGRQRCQTFAREPDAERFLREIEVAVDRGRWLDPRSAEMPLAAWSRVSVYRSAAVTASSEPATARAF